MAKTIGKWPVGSTAVASLNSSYSDSVNNVGREVIVFSAAISGSKFGGLRYGRMAQDGHFEFYGNLASERIFRDFNVYTAAPQGMRFSADKEYAIIFFAGVTSDTANTGLKFFKRASDGLYDVLTSPAGGLNSSYDFDISDDGQFACITSASAGYAQAFKRTGDVWAIVAVVSGLLTTTNGIGSGIRRIFDHNNMMHFGTNSSSGSKTAIQARVYNPGTGSFTEQVLTGLPVSKTYPGIDYYYDGTNYYYAAADLGTPQLAIYKTSDGINFTALTVIGTPNYQHYTPAWDPSGTYLFTIINNIGVQMGVYKRVGDTLTYIDSPFDELFPVFGATTIKHISWSPDSKYVIIAKNNGQNDDDGAWMYRREGDSFYRVSGSHYWSSDVTNIPHPSETGDWLFEHGSSTINYIHWR
tara:strand:+ start:198 stop:1433 length:1236 start_codon:yes stop_codon:yes gene_type:complete